MCEWHNNKDVERRGYAPSYDKCCICLIVTQVFLGWIEDIDWFRAIVGLIENLRNGDILIWTYPGALERKELLTELASTNNGTIYWSNLLRTLEMYETLQSTVGLYHGSCFVALHRHFFTSPQTVKRRIGGNLRSGFHACCIRGSFQKFASIHSHLPSNASNTFFASSSIDPTALVIVHTCRF